MLIVGALALAGAVAFGIQRHLFVSPSQPVSNASTPLGLNVERSGNYLRVSWNRNHPSLRQAKQGVLSIVEGSKERRVRFDTGELASSTVLYEAVSPDVTFKLNVQDDENVSVTESVRAIAIPTPAVPLRPKERKPAVAQRPEPRSEPVAHAPAPVRTGEPGVLHKVLPSVRSDARATIRGTVRVDVKMTVNESGKVTGAEFNNVPRSPYFAKLALQAARKWEFPAGEAGTRLVRFEFTNDEVRSKVLGW
ncbi:MAG: hypothetical protein M3Z36_00060 [Acidobacteriota bacterium]|nr:hypothetical protein [Acidobacteriota bacterium]